MTSPKPVDGLVLINVNVEFARHRDGHWRATTPETGVVAYGATPDLAQEAARDGNLLLIRSWKRRGQKELDRFMREHEIEYRIAYDDQSTGRPTEPTTSAASSDWAVRVAA